ncbi:MAG TPA: GNAT family N-acetyltransferase [Bacteroidia bacterium]|jgi:ribosomal protein S18 acetylase RimI-like enzyme|nr:GNAT family N-acetyltransferase [Bacteroidia bacterium]
MVEIAELFPFDKPVLREIYLTERKRTFHWANTEAYHIDDFDKHTKGEHILVARYNGVIAGFISMWLQENFLHHLYIAHEFQHKGIGSDLLQAGCKLATSSIQLKCLEKNTAAISFYKKHGFKEKGAGQSSDGDFILFERKRA